MSVRTQRLLAIAAIAAAFAHNLSLSWLKWGSALIDNGREIDCARQLAEGKVLYGDVRYLFGPLAPTLNGWLFKMFGVHLNVLIAAGIVSAALMCWLIYRLARLYTTRAPAALIAIAFLYICAFAHLTPNAIFNYVLPYSYAATYGSLTALASLFFLVRHAKKQKSIDFIFSLACLVLTALTKIEILFGALVLHAGFIAAVISLHRFSLRLHLAGYAAALASGAAIYGGIVSKVGYGALYDSMLFQLFATGNNYHRFHMGLMDVSESLLGIVYSLIALCVVFAAGAITSRMAPPQEKSPPVLFAAMVVAFGIYLFLPVELSFRALTLTGASLCALLAWKWMRDPAGRAELLPGLLLWLYGTACLARLGLRVISFHYGFFMLPGALVAFGLLWFKFLPDLFAKAGRPHGAFRYAGTGIFLALIAMHHHASSQLYAWHTAEVNAPRGRLYLLNYPNLAAGTYHAGTIWLLSKLPPETKVVVFPQGAQMTFFAGCTNPLGNFGFTEPEMIGRYDDKHTAEALKAASPELLVLNPGDMMETNSHRFGQDYAVETWAWIRDNYAPCMGIGPDGFVSIYARKGYDTQPILKAAQSAGTQPPSKN